MVFQTIQRFITRSVSGALLGGLYYEQAHTALQNLFHVLIWLTFLFLPLILYEFLGSRPGAFVYSTISFLFFVSCKSINLLLHTRLDKTDVPEAIELEEFGRGANAIAIPIDNSSSVNRGANTEGQRPRNIRRSSRRASIVTLQVGGRILKWQFDRLALESLLDRTFTWHEVVLSTSLGTIASFFSFYTRPRFSTLNNEFLAGFIWLNLAGAHFTLLRRVRFDPCCYRLGIRWTLYSRAFYFIISCCIILFVDITRKRACENDENELLLGYEVFSCTNLTSLKQSALELHLVLPIFFLIGWLPQISTLFFHILEQANLLILGGSGLLDISGGFLAVFFIGSLLTVLALCQYLTFERQGLAQRFLDAFLYATTAGLAHQTSALVGSFSELRDVWYSLTNTVREPRFTAIQLPQPRRILTHKLLPRWNHACLDSRFSTTFLLFVLSFLYHLSRLSSIVGPHLVNALAWITIFNAFLNRGVFFQATRLYAYDCFKYPFRLTSTRLYIMSRRLEYVLLWLLFLSTTEFSIEQLRERDSWNRWFSSFAIIISLYKAIQLTCRQYDAMHWYLLGAQIAWITRVTQDSETWHIYDFLLVSALIFKFGELLLKFQFVLVYSLPWNRANSSISQMLLTVLAIPHSALILSQIILGAIVSAPVYPLLGAAAFSVSYPRPITFWEKNITKSTSLVWSESIATLRYALPRSADDVIQEVWTQMNEAGYDVANLNACFYESITSSLSDCLFDNIKSGAWGCVTEGDFFFLILEGGHFIALVHIMSISSTAVSFQLRGVEARGTLCQQQELVALLSDKQCLKEDDDLVDFPAVLPWRTVARSWMRTWTIRQADWTFPSYAMRSTRLVNLLLSFEDVRKVVLVAVLSCTFQTCSLPSELVDEIVTNFLFDSIPSDILLKPETNDINQRINVDAFVESCLCGQLLDFAKQFIDWASLCFPNNDIDSSHFHNSIVLAHILCKILTHCLLSTCTKNELCEDKKQWDPSLAWVDVQCFVQSVACLFQGDFRCLSSLSQYSWIQSASTPNSGTLCLILQKSIQSAIQLHYKSYQDAELVATYESLLREFELQESPTSSTLVCAESETRWRHAILARDYAELITLRYDTIPFVQAADVGNSRPVVALLHLLRREVDAKVIHCNPESVRGLWTAQQHELLFAANMNEERGSIQEMTAVLRNLIGQSCDIPVGYPNYVSPVSVSRRKTKNVK